MKLPIAAAVSSMLHDASCFLPGHALGRLSAVPVVEGVMQTPGIDVMHILILDL
jgi:hypothetical protein